MADQTPNGEVTSRAKSLRKSASRSRALTG